MLIRTIFLLKGAQSYYLGQPLEHSVSGPAPCDRRQRFAFGFFLIKGAIFASFFPDGKVRSVGDVVNDTAWAQGAFLSVSLVD